MKLLSKYTNRGFSLRSSYLCLLIFTMASSGCKDLYDIPENTEYLSDRVALSTKDFAPVLGRRNLIGGTLNAGGSSTPLKFEIVNFRNSDGTPNDILSVKRDVSIWVDDYTGLESSVDEIEAKRKIEQRPIVEIRSSGDFLFWPSAKNDVLVNYQGATAPALSAGYLFDVKVSNGGGERILKDFTLKPLRERPYEPSERNQLTGVQTAPITPTITNNITGVNYRRMMSNTGNPTSCNCADTNRRDVRVIFKKLGDGNTLTFKFLDKDFKPIDPNLFNLTDWSKLVHGFNMVKTKEYVKYDVAYPIPLTTRPTAYTTTDGGSAKLRFGFWRLGFNAVRIESYIDFNFQIYEKGDWEIAVQFRYDTPKFSNE